MLDDAPGVLAKFANALTPDGTSATELSGNEQPDQGNISESVLSSWFGDDTPNRRTDMAIAAKTRRGNLVGLYDDLDWDSACAASKHCASIVPSACSMLLVQGRPATDPELTSETSSLDVENGEDSLLAQGNQYPFVHAESLIAEQRSETACEHTNTSLSIYTPIYTMLYQFLCTYSIYIYILIHVYVFP